MSWSLEQAYAYVNKIKERAAEDEAFKLLALNDPEMACRLLTGESLPDGIRMSARDHGPDGLDIVVHGLQETWPTGELGSDEATLD
ncbi:hypothetical protein SAMN05216312_11396 [Cohnella sp. OV330]|uniref:hypothetical protein n=1 Tax=Cohnella sp. OV330 TaxID=1855288 RepID=UPI0008DF1D88|nr:hypothetical protein [Cohnella sp. OV330]SFB56011.1 hypothetical protein SAMN05216312_11396 [Cohnella sp. OV330]